jgi:hypothetical protein
MKSLAASFCLLLLAGCVTIAPRETSGIVGTWRLVSYEERAEGQPVRRPYGDKPIGLLTYDATGHMAIQVMKVPHPKVASGTDETITPEEKIALFDAYTAYFGTYSVDADRGMIVYHPEGDIADVFIGEVEERPFTLKGDTLTLTPQWDETGVHWTGVRIFERVN